MPWLNISYLIYKNSTVLCTVLGSVDVCIRPSEGHSYGAIFISGVCFIVFIFHFFNCLIVYSAVSLLAFWLPFLTRPELS